ncbi:CLUMA_CG014724, isoform A [Clunio marinus]|uniref:CLUMA_CG014724, isoform A n=1 Tax=Clunio marinus TaxID=568069 RepID=A0A1J1IRT5_9DIPT|nr:CLUMA_CG014724, isoform A [Clunio marinus]
MCHEEKSIGMFLLKTIYLDMYNEIFLGGLFSDFQEREKRIKVMTFNTLHRLAYLAQHIVSLHRLCHVSYFSFTLYWNKLSYSSLFSKTLTAALNSQKTSTMIDLSNNNINKEY